MKAIFLRLTLLLIALTLSKASLYAQPPIKKPEKKQQETTTTTTKPQQKPRTNTNTNKSSQTKTDTNTQTSTDTNTTNTLETKPDTNTHPNSNSASTSTNTQESNSSTTTTTTITPTPAPKPTTGIINGHEWVDLGLSVKWATCNVGASSPSDYGDYYAWGETSTKSSYTEKNNKTYGKSMGSIAGKPQYDAARANWGSTWRLPTASEIDDLLKKCKWTWTTQGGHNGYKITGPNGNSIFLPAAGWRRKTSHKDAGKLGDYWSATPTEDNADHAYGLDSRNDDFSKDWDYRDHGRSIRPVSE